VFSHPRAKRVQGRTQICCDYRRAARIFRDVIFESSCNNAFVFITAGISVRAISHFIDEHSFPRRFLGICRPSHMLSLAVNTFSTEIGWLKIGRQCTQEWTGKDTGPEPGALRRRLNPIQPELCDRLPPNNRNKLCAAEQRVRFPSKASTVSLHANFMYCGNRQGQRN
jgi:hypothetical protein